jgi:hypothetical protein
MTRSVKEDPRAQVLEASLRDPLKTRAGWSSSPPSWTNLIVSYSYRTT